MMCLAPDLLIFLTPIIAASAFPELLFLILRLVVVRGPRQDVLLDQLSSGNFQPSDSAEVYPGSAVLASRSCPFEPEAVVPLLLSLLPHGAAIEAPVPVVGAPDCPTDHSVLRLHVPWVAPGLVVAQLRTRIVVPAAVAALVGQAAAIAGKVGLSRCSTREELEKCVNPLLCRHRSRLRGAAGADWCTVT